MNMKRNRITWKAHLIRLWREWGRPLLVVLVVLTTFRSAVADWNDVPSGSMEPTILEGDRIFVNKLAYDLKLPFTTWHLLEWAGPQRGDIVVCFSPANGTRLVKRVVALPGDRLEMLSNQLLINGRPAAYAPLEPQVISQIPPERQPSHRFATETVGDQRHPIMTTPGRRAPRFIKPITVPPEQYFVMGDNRDNSADSRVFGFVARDRIVGEALVVVVSVDRNHYYLPRWERFFTRLR